jgi:hypothetical protein
MILGNVLASVLMTQLFPLREYKVLHPKAALKCLTPSSASCGPLHLQHSSSFVPSEATGFLFTGASGIPDRSYGNFSPKVMKLLRTQVNKPKMFR